MLITCPPDTQLQHAQAEAIGLQAPLTGISTSVKPSSSSDCPANVAWRRGEGAVAVAGTSAASGAASCPSPEEWLTAVQCVASVPVLLPPEAVCAAGGCDSLRRSHAELLLVVFTPHTSWNSWRSCATPRSASFLQECRSVKHQCRSLGPVDPQALLHSTGHFQVTADTPGSLQASSPRLKVG